MIGKLKMNIVFSVLLLIAFNCKGTDANSNLITGGNDQGANQKNQITNISDLQNDLHTIAQTDTPTVVYIGTEKTVTQQYADPFDFFFGNPNPSGRGTPRTRQYKQQALGSGVIYAKKGDSYYIVTNNHVIEGADKITVVVDQKKTYNGKILGTDQDVDIAIVQVDTKDSLKIAKFGDSSKLQVGDFVIAIGNPFGLSGSMTFGIISAIGRNDISEGNKPSLTDFIQTDASINPGNSGGALLNMNAEVIGINTLIYSQSGGNIGIGFAIPVNVAKRVADQMLSGKKNIEHGYLGVSFAELSEDGAKKLGLKAGTTGMLVSSVVPKGPADKAGIKAGDILLELNGKQLSKSGDLTVTVGNAAPGTKFTFKIFRDNQTITKEVILGNRTEMNTAASNNAKTMTLDDYGLSVTDLTPATRDQNKLPAKINGVLVTDVVQGSPADQAGLQTGDVIFKINNKNIANFADLTKYLKDNSDKDNYFYVFRDGSEFVVTM
jgi:serine protease Do